MLRMKRDNPRRWFGHPAVIAALAAYLVWDFLSINYYWHARSTVVSTLRPHVGLAQMGVFIGVLARTPEGLAFLASVDDGMIQIQENADPLYEVEVTFNELPIGRSEPNRSGFMRTGFYHLTRATTAMFIRDPRGLLSERERGQATCVFRGAMAATILGKDYAHQLALLEGAEPERVGDGWRIGAREERIIWSGYARNAVVLGALAWIVIGFSRGGTATWTRDGVRALVRRIRRERPYGVCRACGYQVGDLARCPECGTANSEHVASADEPERR